MTIIVIHKLVDETYVLMCSVSAFFLVYAIAFYVVFPKWKPKSRLDAASCSMSIIHGSFATFLSVYSLRQSPWKLDAPNTGFQNKLMDFSLAYFLVDLLHYILFVPQDFHFILHHIATTTYIFSCRYFTKHGGVSVMALLGLAEMTSPVQNTWTITGLASKDSSFAARIYDCLSPFFALYFTVVRGVIAPCLAWNLCQYYLTGQADAVIPRWLATYWMLTVVLAIVGSLLWVSKVWIELWHKIVDGRVRKVG